MKVLHLKQNQNETHYPIDLIDSSLFYLSKTSTVFPVADFTIYENKGQRSKTIHSVKNAIEFPYEYPYINYAVRMLSNQQVFYTFFRFNLLSKNLKEVGTVHYSFEAELEGIFMTDTEVMYTISEIDEIDYEDETTIYLLDAKKQKQYVINEPTLQNSISTPALFLHKGDSYLLLNPYYMETWEKEDNFRQRGKLKSENEYIAIIPLKHFIRDIKAGSPLNLFFIEEIDENGFSRVIAENGDSIFYIRKDFISKKEELVELNKDTLQKKYYFLPSEFSYHSIRIFNDNVYFVSIDEDYFYSPMKKEIFRLEHTYFQHLSGIMNVYVHYLDQRFIVADCWTRNNGVDLFYVAIIDKELRRIQYFEDKTLGCEVYDQTVIIY